MSGKSHFWSLLPVFPKMGFLGKSLKALQVLAFSLKYKRSAYVIAKNKIIPQITGHYKF